MEFSGKDIDSLFVRAENELKRNRKEFIYEIHEEKSKIMKSKTVTLKILGFKTYGKLEIKNGEIIKHPGEIAPRICPGENVRVLINDKPISKITPVEENDKIELVVNNTKASREVKLTIDEEKLNAYIEVSYLNGKELFFKDADPTNELTIDAYTKNEIQVEKYTLTDIEKLLRDNKITYGINWDNVKKVLEGGEGLIASGKKPIPPIDDKIKLLFEDEKKPTYDINNDRVDYNYKGEVNFVEVNKVLAIREEGKDGELGYDIHGNAIMPEERKIFKLIAGTGCELFGDGNKIISLQRGMPSIRGERICVFPVHTIAGDVDIKTGNVIYAGDIVIQGNVKEGMVVKAGNNINIKGSIAEAKLSSIGDIYIAQNVVLSKVVSGELQINQRNLLEFFKKYEEFMMDLIKMVEGLKKSNKIPRDIQLSHLVKVLVESKFKHIKDLIISATKLIETPNECQINDEINNMWSKVVSINDKIQGKSTYDMMDLVLIVKELNDFTQKYTINLTPSNVTVGYCQNSDIYATNNVVIKGKGCYNTNIQAEGDVIIMGHPGILRGGQVVTKGNIKVKEVGSLAGVPTVLKTSKQNIIEAEIAHDNTIICFDDLIYKLNQRARKLKAYVDKGELVVEKMKF